MLANGGGAGLGFGLRLGLCFMFVFVLVVVFVLLGGPQKRCRHMLLCLCFQALRGLPHTPTSTSTREEMKSAPLWLAGGWEWSLAMEPLAVDGDRMTALIHYERQRWKKVNFFAKKPLPGSLFQHFQMLCMPSFIDLHTRNTRPCDVVCLRSKHFRSIAGMIAPPAKIYARNWSRSRWNMKHFRQTARGCLLHQ